MSGEFEIITPVKMPEKGGHAHTDSLRQRGLLKLVALALVFVAILVGGGLLFHFLSKNAKDASAPASEESSPAPQARDLRQEMPAVKDAVPKPEAVDPAQVAREKTEAENKLADFVRVHKELEERGAAQWGGDLYLDMTRLGKEADALFLEKDYRSASLHYLQATAKAQELADQSEETLRRLIAEGSLALANGEAESAQEKFTAALGIDPANKLAKRGLERAEKYETVLGLIDSGKRHEQGDKLSFALADYQKALRLDPQSKEARTALNRVTKLIREREFQQLMSAGLTAYHDNDYQQAKAALLKAQSIRPNSPEVRNALVEVNEAIRLARMEKLHQKALLAEQSEDWQRALESYVAVLAIDATIQFAVQGKQRSLEQIRIAKRIDFYLKKPAVLESDPHLATAILLLQEAASVEPKGQQLKANIEKLDQLVSIAQTPVRVTLESDNLTEVAVYKVGKLGRFDVRHLQLRPGTYTVVGARDGYQDVRRKVVVRPGPEPLRFAVICRVKI